MIMVKGRYKQNNYLLLFTFSYKFSALSLLIFSIIVSVEWKLRDDDVNALRAPLRILGTVFCVGSSTTPTTTTGLASFSSYEWTTARPHAQLTFSSFGYGCVVRHAWSKVKATNLWANIIKLYRLWGKKHLHNFKVTYGHITITVRQSTVVKVSPTKFQLM